ncbi:PREDICTED: Fanconi anemia group C protein-like isoform X2 [Priapulus caudatus]|uniref:Fanconi anemia group C protein-like isoform X2 n=1 Tax=Priapulus caudatus TaxID=37621 RepID=A0ABM1EQB4_PRICU|nr:PREDICTED: Fanconi anemia group C protein-like isoform X2 [Priapulus caudatus]
MCIVTASSIDEWFEKISQYSMCMRHWHCHCGHGEARLTFRKSSVNETTLNFLELTNFLTELHAELCKLGNIAAVTLDLPNTGKLLAKCQLKLIMQHGEDTATSDLSPVLCISRLDAKKQVLTNFFSIFSECVCKNTDDQMLYPVENEVQFQSKIDGNLRQMVMAIPGLITNVYRDQRTCGSYACGLSDDICRALWLLHIPTLEQELLWMLEALAEKQAISKQVAIKVIQRRKMPMACSRSAHLYSLVIDMWHSLWEMSKQAPHLTTIIGWFSECVRQEATSTIPAERCILEAYQKCWRPLVNLLMVSPKDLPLPVCELYLHRIWEQLNKAVSTGTGMSTGLLFTLIQFSGWYYMSLILLLYGCESDMNVFLRVAWSYHDGIRNLPSTESLSEVKAFGSGLRAVMSKTHLEQRDIPTISTISSAEETSRCVISHILLLFMVCSEGGLSLTADIIHMATYSHDSDVQIASWLDAQEYCTAIGIHGNKASKIASLLETALATQGDNGDSTLHPADKLKNVLANVVRL